MSILYDPKNPRRSVYLLKLVRISVESARQRSRIIPAALDSRIYTFEPGKVTLRARHPFQRATREIGADRIAAIVDHPVYNRRRVELKLADTSRISVVEAERTQTLTADPPARKLADLLGKPLETEST